MKLVVFCQAGYLFTIFHDIVLSFKKLVFLIVYSHLPVFTDKFRLLSVFCLL